MSYFAAACGAGFGMLVSLIVFSNVWRFNILPKEYDFIHEFGKSLIRIDNRKFAYAIRFIIGMLLHPVIFVCIWGKDGFLGINPYNSSVVSALVLVSIEAALFSFVLWTKVLNISPKNLVVRLIILQFAVHMFLGIIMGFTYDVLPI